MKVVLSTNLQMKRFALLIVIFAVYSCSPNYRITGNYISVCNFDGSPNTVLKIMKTGEFEYYTPLVAGEKVMGTYKIEENHYISMKLYLYSIILKIL